MGAASSLCHEYRIHIVLPHILRHWKARLMVYRTCMLQGLHNTCRLTKLVITLWRSQSLELTQSKYMKHVRLYLESFSFYHVKMLYHVKIERIWKKKTFLSQSVQWLQSTMTEIHHYEACLSQARLRLPVLQHGARLCLLLSDIMCKSSVGLSINLTFWNSMWDSLLRKTSFKLDNY